MMLMIISLQSVCVILSSRQSAEFGNHIINTNDINSRLDRYGLKLVLSSYILLKLYKLQCLPCVHKKECITIYHYQSCSV